jgi:peptidoglycan DL-endopeptidase CwlO
VASYPKYRRSITVLALCMAALTGAGLNSSVVASPRPQVADPVKTAQSLLERLERTSERVNQLKLKSVALNLQVKDLEVRRRHLAMVVAGLQQRKGAIADDAYRNGPLSGVAQVVLSETPDAALERIQLGSALSRKTDDEEHAAAMAQLDLARVDLGLKQAKSSYDESVAEASKLKKELSSKYAEAKREAAILDASSKASRSSTRLPVGVSVGSGKGATAVRFAQAQLGKPYAWGAEGPGSYDCSGLTLAAWAAAGVSLPHYTGSQWTSGAQVSRSELQAGDLVFWYGDLHHVGLFVGGSTVIHAPRTGKTVEYTDIDSMPFAGAVRP